MIIYVQCWSFVGCLQSFTARNDLNHLASTKAGAIQFEFQCVFARACSSILLLIFHSPMLAILLQLWGPFFGGKIKARWTLEANRPCSINSYAQHKKQFHGTIFSDNDSCKNYINGQYWWLTWRANWPTVHKANIHMLALHQWPNILIPQSLH